VGIIGCGYWGPNLVRTFVEIGGASLRGVADRDRSRLDRVATRYPDVRVLSEDFHDLFEELSRDLEIAMVIATHNRALAARADRTLLLEDGRLTDTDVREVVP